MNLFETTATVENRSGETLYLTPITTTSGQPEVIWQTRLIRQRDVPLKPGHSVTLEYDAADSPLAGIVVCRQNADCRLLAVNSSDAYYIETFDELAPVEPAWLVAIQSHPRYDFVPLVLLMFCFVPIALFLSWLYLGTKHTTTV